jgi:hypothetical protein
MLSLLQFITAHGLNYLNTMSRTFFIHCKLALKHDCLNILSSGSCISPKGYYPVATIDARTIAESLQTSIPNNFIIPDEELHAQLNLFNKRVEITHYVYSKLSKRADHLHVIFTTSPISIKGYRRVSALNAFSIPDAMNQFIPKIFLTPNLELLDLMNIFQSNRS